MSGVTPEPGDQQRVEPTDHDGAHPDAPAPTHASPPPGRGASGRDRPAHYLIADLGRALLWGYGHYFIYAAAAAVGAAIAVAIDLATGHAEIGSTVAGAFLAVPVALYVALLWALHHEPRPDAVVPDWLGPLAVLLLLAAPFTSWPAVTCGLILVTLLAVKIGLRHRRARTI